MRLAQRSTGLVGLEKGLKGEPRWFFYLRCKKHRSYSTGLGMEDLSNIFSIHGKQTIVDYSIDGLYMLRLIIY